MAHVTGGGLAANLARVLPEELIARVERATWTPPAVFDVVRRAGGVAQADLEGTLNAGVGMLAMLPGEDVDAAIALLDQHGVPAWVCGEVSAADGSGGRVELLGQHPGWA